MALLFYPVPSRVPGLMQGNFPRQGSRQGLMSVGSGKVYVDVTQSWSRPAIWVGDSGHDRKVRGT